MNKNKVIFGFLVIVSGVSQGIQERATLQALPTDIKRYLMPFVVSGDTTRAVEQEILNIAHSNKTFNALINEPKFMFDLLQGIERNARYTATVVDLVERLQKHKALLPVMRDSNIVAWAQSLKKQLRLGDELYTAAESCDNLYADIPAEKAVSELLKHKNVNLNWRNNYGNTALIIASGCAGADVINFLLEAGANPDIRNQDGMTALMLAIDAGLGLPTITAFIKAGVDVNIRDNNGDTALMHAKGVFALGRGSSVLIIKALEEAAVKQKKA